MCETRGTLFLRSCKTIQAKTQQPRQDCIQNRFNNATSLKPRYGESNVDRRRRGDLIGIILAANKILREKSFFANKKGFYGLAESGRAHKRDGRYLPDKYTTFLP